MQQSPADPSGEGPRLAIERNPRLRFLIPSIIAVAFLIEQLDSTIVVTAIPKMAEALGTTSVRLNLAITAYILSTAMFIPVSGWFADRFGSRRIFTLALLIFTIGSMLCGLATSIEMLVATRALQGFGGAMMTPVGRLILLRSFPRSELIRAMAYMTYPALIGPVVGPLLGGALTTYLSWRWIFYINVPIGLLGAALTLIFIEEVKSERTPRFDFPGFLMIGFGLVLLQYGMENIGRPVTPPWAIAGLILIAIVLLLGFYLHARRRPDPAVDLTLFRQRSFRISTLYGGLVRLAMNGVPYLLPLLLQLGLGVSPMVSGSLTFVAAGGSLVSRSTLPFILRVFGFRPVLVVGAVAASLALVTLTLIAPGMDRWLIVGLVAFYGICRAFSFMTSNTLSYADIPPPQLSRATSLGGVLQQLSVSFGVSTAAMLLGLLSPEGQPLTPARFHAVFLIMALLPLIAIPGFLRLRAEDGMEVRGGPRRDPQ